MSKEISMKSDYIFGEFFSRKENEEFLKEFLTSIMNVEIKTIEVIKQANLGKIRKDNKFGVLDLKVTLNDGIIVDVELQLDNNHNWEKRATFYAGKLIAEDLKEGEDYEKLKDIVIISILDYNLTKLPEYKTESVIVSKENKECELIKGLKYYFIELPKFRKQKPDMKEKLNQWLALIDGESEEMIEVAKRTNEQIEKAVEQLMKLRADKEVVAIADFIEKARRDEISAKNTAKRRGHEEGMKEGMQEGMKQGRKQGLEKGLEKGRKQGLEEGREQGIQQGMIEIARQMLEDKMDINIIIKYTGLSRKEIEKLNK